MACCCLWDEIGREVEEIDEDAVPLDGTLEVLVAGGAASAWLHSDHSVDHLRMAVPVCNSGLAVALGLGFGT